MSKKVCDKVEKRFSKVGKKKAKYRCSKCDAVANKRGRLCKPGAM